MSPLPRPLATPYGALAAVAAAVTATVGLFAVRHRSTPGASGRCRVRRSGHRTGVGVVDDRNGRGAGAAPGNRRHDIVTGLAAPADQCRPVDRRRARCGAPGLAERAATSGEPGDGAAAGEQSDGSAAGGEEDEAAESTADDGESADAPAGGGAVGQDCRSDS